MWLVEYIVLNNEQMGEFTLKLIMSKKYASLHSYTT